MSEWQDISTAPKDRKVLLFGRIDPNNPFDLIRWREPSVFSGMWDDIDRAWVPCGGTWEGPFMEATHWMPLPAKPTTGE